MIYVVSINDTEGNALQFYIGTSYEAAVRIGSKPNTVNRQVRIFKGDVSYTVFKVTVQ